MAEVLSGFDFKFKKIILKGQQLFITSTPRDLLSFIFVRAY